MGDEVDSNIIKSTQNSLGKYVKRPPLSEKLLKKPPFRFIHDIITSILKTTGFFNGLFEENELISDNVKDRESKILFLNKIIYVIGTTTGKTLTVKPSKVIAGQEPDKTNELLQCLALALDNKLSSDEAVSQYKQSLTKPVSSDTKVKDVKKVAKENTNLKLSTKSVTKNDNNTVVKPKQREVKKKESLPKKASQSVRSTSKKLAESTKENDHNKKRVSGNSQDQPIVNSVETSKNTDKTPEITQNKDLLLDEKKLLDNTTTEIENNIILIKKNDTNSNLDPEKDIKNKENHVPFKEQPSKSFESESEIHTTDSNFNNIKDKTESTNNDIYEEKRQENNLSNTNNVSSLSRSTEPRENSFETSINETKTPDDTNTKVIRPLSVRPSSSRPGAPRLREKHEETITDADNLLIAKVNIIAENTVQEEDEESSIVIVEHDVPTSEVNGELAHLDANEHGHLVQQILNSQKEFSHVSGKTEIEWQFGAKKARDIINQEIDQLRFNLQALSRVANPLGKLLDHIQEDVEVMRQESQHWTKTYEDAHKELRRQKKSNDVKLKPLHSKIKLLDAEINEKQEKINDLKITIHKNALRIDKLLANGNKQ